MKANEYKAWYRRNDPESARRGLEEYSRPFGERYERPPEYSFGQEAYPQYPERLDISEKQEAYQRGEEDKKQASKSKSSQGDKAKKLRGNSATRGILSAIATPVVGIVVGAVILVSGYQAIEAQNIPEPTPIVATVECDWGADFDSAILVLTDDSGAVITELPAEVVMAEVAATCTESGTRTYTATAIYDEQTYSKVHVETISPLGHTFDEGKVVISENGPPMMVYECTHCHEKISIAITVEENEE